MVRANFCAAFSLALLALALTRAAAEPPAPQEQFQPAEKAPPLLAHVSPVAALNDVVGRYAAYKGPLVIAFGEYHETTANNRKKGKGGVPSALRRFSEQLFPVLAKTASDIVLETWITDGNCGKEESSAVQDVKKTTERPASTEDELVTLVKQAKAAGVQPHILKLSCEDYKSLTSTGEVDYEKLLTLLTELLQKKIADIAQRREREGGNRHILVYGGALHNDLQPKPELAAFSFGPALQKELHGGYIELDLYVPEFIERDASLVKEPWYGTYKKQTRPNQAMVVRRAPGSYILLFPRSAKR